MCGLSAEDCVLCEAGLCLNPDHGVVRLYDPSRAKTTSTTEQVLCAFCLAGICHDGSHYSGFPDAPVKIFDIRRTTFPPIKPLTELIGSQPTKDRQDLLRPRSNPKITIQGVSLEEYLTTRRPPSLDEEAKEISTVLGHEIGTRRTYSIPRIIHRFWTGGPMRTETVTALAADGRRALAAGWQSRLWYSSVIEEELADTIAENKRRLRQSQRDALAVDGYQICDIHEGATGLTRLPGLAVLAAKTVLSGGGYDDVKYFSDLARLQYLFSYGGFHIDVDMTLGDLELGRTYYHNDPDGQIPLMGTLARDSSDVGVVNRLRFLQESRTALRVNRLQYEDAVKFLAVRAAQGAGMFNALIASRASTANLALAIEDYLRRKELFTGMALNRYLLLGNSRANPLQRQADLERASALSVPPYVLRLNQITPESDL